MKNIFNSKKTITASAPRTFGPTKKKKNTYVLNMRDALFDADLFSWCSETPMQIIKKNGEYTSDHNQGFAELTPFPNPMTTRMVQVYSITKPVMGKLAATVVEYLDKETGKPVALLFPHTTRLYIHGGKSYEELAQRLNHATRRDLARQLEMRNRLITQVNQARAR